MLSSNGQLFNTVTMADIMEWNNMDKYLSTKKVLELSFFSIFRLNLKDFPIRIYSRSFEPIGPFASNFLPLVCLSDYLACSQTVDLGCLLHPVVVYYSPFLMSRIFFTILSFRCPFGRVMVAYIFPTPFSFPSFASP